MGNQSVFHNFEEICGVTRKKHRLRKTAIFKKLFFCIFNNLQIYLFFEVRNDFFCHFICYYNGNDNWQ